MLAKKDPVNKELAAIRSDQVDSVRARRQSWGDQKLTENMVPGYTGARMRTYMLHTCTCTRIRIVDYLIKAHKGLEKFTKIKKSMWHNVPSERDTCVHDE